MLMWKVLIFFCGKCTYLSEERKCTYLSEESVHIFVWKGCISVENVHIFLWKVYRSFCGKCEHFSVDERYGVATINRLLKIIGLFCRI